jgi:two-component system, OmpR family, sensor kinase
MTVAADPSQLEKTNPTRPTASPDRVAPSPGGRRRRAGLSVRTRIVVSLAVLVASALTVAGVIIYVLEASRLQASSLAQADQERAEFASLQRADRFSDINELLYEFLERNVPSDNEMLIGWVDDGPRYVSTQRHRALTDDLDFRAGVRALADRGGSHRVNSSVGELLVTVQPVTERRPAERQPVGSGSAPDDGAGAPPRSPATGALVIVSFLDDDRDQLLGLMRTCAAVGLLSLGAIVVVARWQAGRLLAPLRRLNDTAREIGSGDLSSRIPETGNDDITALTRTVNDMLGRLDGSFNSQRRFLDEAGHELRTPLTVLRGHLELLDSADSAEVAETRTLLLDEVDRMSRLVGDMILLAKSNRPDFISPAPIQLDQLISTAYAKAVALGERSWRLDAVTTATLNVDQQRLTQALLQLADNAVKHTDPGDEIGIGASVEPDQVRLWVRDSGDGISPADRTAIFERFGRGQVRVGDEGFGLGLSIVTAIAEAHGGSVAVRDANPRGAEFSLTLPREALWHDS